MNKSVIKSLVSNGQLVEHPANVLSGQVKGYYAVISLKQQKYAYITINATKGQYEPPISVFDMVNGLKMQYKFVEEAIVKGSHIEVKVQLPGLAKHIPERITLILDYITNYLSQNGFVTGCAYCGNNSVPLSLNDVYGELVVCCDQCCNQQTEFINVKRKDFKESSGNYFAGLVGALFASLIGFAVYFLIYQLGYIAAVSGIIMVVCVLKGFELLGGKLNILGVATCFIVSLGVIYLANRFCYANAIMDVMKDSYNKTDENVFDYFKEFGYWIHLNEDNYHEYIESLIYGLSSTFIVGIMYCVNAYRTSAYKAKLIRY